MATKSSTPSSGSMNWATAANWSDLAVPANSDNVTLGPGTASVDSGLAQQAVTLATFNIPASFSGQVGNAAQAVKSVSGITRTSNTATATSTAHGYSNGDTVIVSGANQSDYNIAAVISNVTTDTFDYTVANTPTTPATGTILVQKAEELHIGATNFRIGDPSGTTTGTGGATRVKVNFGSVQVTGVCVKTGGTADVGKEPLRVRGTHASNKFFVMGGTVGFATNRPSDVATFSEISVSGDQTAVANIGSGVTLTTFRQTTGTATINCAVTNVHQDGGLLTTQGSGAVTAANIGGVSRLNSTGTITTLTVFGGGTADFTLSMQARTVTNCILYKGATLKYDPAVVTFTNPIQLEGCAPKDVTITIPLNCTIAIAAV